MDYEDFREYCIGIMVHKIGRTPAENLVDWIFPKEYKDKYEEKLTESDEFLKYTTKVLGE